MRERAREKREGKGRKGSECLNGLSFQHLEHTVIWSIQFVQTLQTADNWETVV